MHRSEAQCCVPTDVVCSKQCAAQSTPWKQSACRLLALASAGGEATLSRKSVGQSVSEALRVPLSPFMSTQRDGGTSDGGAETDASRRSGGRFRNVFRPSTAHAQLGQTSEETRERAGRSRQRRQRDAAGRPFTSGAGFDSDKESSSSGA